MNASPSERFLRRLEPASQKLSPAREATFYPAQFPIFLREQMQGKSILEVAEFFGIPPEQVIRLLAGEWKPSKEICRKMGLKVVYALTAQPGPGVS